jgi:hypothetical protein
MRNRDRRECGALSAQESAFQPVLHPFLPPQDLGYVYKPVHPSVIAARFRPFVVNSVLPRRRELIRAWLISKRRIYFPPDSAPKIAGNAKKHEKARLEKIR